MLSTAQIADACIRLKLPVRVAPPGLLPLEAGMRVAGPARPVRHYGSVDVFLESTLNAKPGEVLVVDNGGRTDEACIGDLTVLELKFSLMAGVLVWGLHRDTVELRAIGFPVFTYGRTPTGPMRLEQRAPNCFTVAQFGPHRVTPDDYVFADDDGAIFVAHSSLSAVSEVAQTIQAAEQGQAAAVGRGRPLREQLQLQRFIAARTANPALSFRQHLQEVKGAIET